MAGTPVYSVHLSGTPVGTLKLWATDRGLRRLDFRTGPDLAPPGERLVTGTPPDHLVETLQRLRDYFGGRIQDFAEVPLDLGALTDFQLHVYDHLRAVRPGHVTTYGTLSRALGLGDGGARAVGQAVGANPAAIVIPCHRVVGADLALHGFSGGLHRKAALLRLEGLVVDGDKATSRVRPEELRLPL